MTGLAAPGRGGPGDPHVLPVIDPAEVVASLMMGFWASLLRTLRDADHEATLWGWHSKDVSITAGCKYLIRALPRVVVSDPSATIGDEACRISPIVKATDRAELFGAA